MRKIYLLLLLFFIYNFSSGQIVQWTFETSIPSTAGPHAAEVGTGTALGFHAGATTYSNPAGNGSVESFSSNSWAVDDYYQFQFPTTGFQNISIVWDATGSGTGPRDFKVQYSTDGSTFTDAGTYSLTAEVWTSASYNALSTRTLDLSGVAALNNVPALYIRLIVTTTTSIVGGIIAGGGTSRVDNFTVNGDAMTSNTISLDAISGLLFNIDCFTDGTGTVDFTSVGTFNAGNIYTAQLSDAAGSFATPTNIGTLGSTLNSGTINIAIPAGTPSGVGYRVRIRSSNPVVTSNTSAAITVNLSGICVSTPTDYFRTKATGNWNAAATWESSVSGAAGSWINATLTPTSTASTIQIRNGHTVTALSAIIVDEVIIESGGILVNQMPAVNALTIANGPVNDLDIQNGGMYHILSTQGFANYQSISAGATIIIRTGGVIRLGDGSIFAGAANHSHASISTSYVWENGSIFEWNSSGSFTATGIIFFPDVDAATIPIFRTIVNVGNVGGGTTTRFNGLFESLGTISFNATGAKIFRNGIRNAGIVTATATCGQFTIDGVSAELGGSAGIIAPATGIQIGSGGGTTVTVTSSKTITGDISLLSTNTFVELGTNTLTVSGNVNGGTQTSFIRTNGSGLLTLNNLTTARTFPIGTGSSYNPVILSNGGGLNLSARVETGINPIVALPAYGIDRTWNLLASPTAGVAVDAVFQYAAADANTGAMPQPQDMEILMNDGIAWSITSGNVNITPGGGDPAITVTTAAGLAIPTSSTPIVLGLNGGWVLPINCIIACRSAIQNNNGIISWDVSSCTEVLLFEVQRAVNGGTFQPLGTITPGTALAYSYTDAMLARGTNLYRIKIIANNGAVKYSNTVAIINDTKGLLITALSPNPVNDKGSLVINSAKPATVNFIIHDIAGRPVKQWKAIIREGSNIITVDAASLPNGVYHLLAATGDTRTVIRFVKQ